jgi:hypothetical protein
LTVAITRIEAAGDNYYYPLLVVNNPTERSYAKTHWSCTFYSKNDPMHEDTFWIENVAANGKTAHRSITKTSAKFDSTSCRLLSARSGGGHESFDRCSRARRHRD